MDSILSKDEFFIAPFFEEIKELLEDDETGIDLMTYHFVDYNLEKNRDKVIKVVNYLRTLDITFLDFIENKEDIELLKNIFNYFGCDEGFIINSIINKKYIQKFTINKIHDSKNIQKNKILISQLYEVYERTIKMFELFKINFDNLLYEQFHEPKYNVVFDSLDTDKPINFYKIKDISDLEDEKLKNVKCLIFDDNFNESIESVVFPDSITQIRFGEKFNQSLKNCILPNFLTILHFGDRYVQEIPVGVLPSSLLYLKLGGRCNKSIKPNVLPENLTHLIFGYKYNKRIEINTLPKSLTYLKFGDKYDKPIEVNVLPENLTHLIFGYSYNKQIKENVLPKKLKLLHFGTCFDKIILPNSLPTSLTHLKLGYFYNKIIPKTYLEGITHIILQNKKNLNQLPSSLIDLTIVSSTMHWYLFCETKLPPLLTYLTIHTAKNCIHDYWDIRYTSPSHKYTKDTIKFPFLLSEIAIIKDDNYLPLNYYGKDLPDNVDILETMCKEKDIDLHLISNLFPHYY